MKVRVLKKHRCRAVGSTYEVKRERDLKTLMALGLVVPVAEKTKPQAAKKAPSNKRAYKRKDMQAEQAVDVVEKPVEAEPEDTPDTDNDTEEQAEE